MTREAIILAGGLGTRLRDTVPGVPKCMAPVAGRPFLFYVINYLRSQGVEQFIFSLGYKHELIAVYLQEQFPTLNYQCSVESEPLGTGGGLKLAMEKATAANVLVANGDTLFKADVDALSSFHAKKRTDCTLALKPMRDFNRYGAVELNANQSISHFREKQFFKEGLINGGIYLLDRDKFLQEDIPDKFSFEKDYLERLYDQRRFFGFIDDAYFIDIGIPEDYTRAQHELARPPLSLSAIDQTWTLFIDRDGVINYEKKDGYILNWDEFRFYEGVKEGFGKLSGKFGKIIIISNQRGVGRELMTEDDLQDIHRNMEREIESAGGRIDKIYYCTSTDNKHACRKPNPGMAFMAKKDMPAIDLSKTIILGNKPSDMQFGRNAGIYTVFVRTTNPEQPFPHPDIDLAVDSLPAFAKAL